MEGLCNVVSIACGQDHSLALCAAGHVFSWGAKLGIFPPGSSHKPRQGSSLRDI